MRVASKIGGHWEISADNIRPQAWEAIHSSFEEDGTGPRFHQHASADTLEELYVAIAEVEDDAVETVRVCEGRHMDPAQVEMVRAVLAQADLAFDAIEDARPVTLLTVPTIEAYARALGVRPSLTMEIHLAELAGQDTLLLRDLREEKGE